MARLMVTIKAARDSTKIRAQLVGEDVLKAVLPPPRRGSRAAEMLLESLGRWFELPVCAVVYAGGEVDSSALDLCDGFGFGNKTGHYEVEIHGTARRRGMGSFADLRPRGVRGAP